MRELYERYIDNLIQVQDLLKPRFGDELSQEAMVVGIRDSASKLHQLCKTNDELLREVLFERRPEDLDSADVRELQEFADSLFEKESLDTGIAHYIHRLLLEYAGMKEDRDLRIRELYYAGVTLLHVRPIVLQGQARNPFRRQIRDYFKEGASFADQYDEIADERTRFYIRSCRDRQNEFEYQFVFPHREAFGEEEKRQLLNFVFAYHPPTYVHSLMVAWASAVFCRQMARTAPELLVGTLGCTDEESVRSAEQRLCRCAYHSGLCHDLGKSRILNYIGLYGRRLLEEEFACVKMHPFLGSILLKGIGCGDLAEAALHHHQWADGKGGYPYPCEPCRGELKMIVNIVSVADSLDAATDNIGRSYASAKTFAQLTGELREGAGSRYDAGVVRLLDDTEFYRRLERELTPRRQKIYCDVYRRSAAPDQYEEAAGQERAYGISEGSV